MDARTFTEVATGIARPIRTSMLSALHMIQQNRVASKLCALINHWARTYTVCVNYSERPSELAITGKCPK